MKPISEEELRKTIAAITVIEMNGGYIQPLSELQMDNLVQLIKQYGNQCRVDELEKHIERVGDTELSEYPNGVVYSGRMRISELTQTNEEKS